MEHDSLPNDLARRDRLWVLVAAWLATFVVGLTSLTGGVMLISAADQHGNTIRPLLALGLLAIAFFSLTPFILLVCMAVRFATMAGLAALRNAYVFGSASQEILEHLGCSVRKYELGLLTCKRDARRLRNRFGGQFLSQLAAIVSEHFPHDYERLREWETIVEALATSAVNEPESLQKARDIVVMRQARPSRDVKSILRLSQEHGWATIQYLRYLSNDNIEKVLNTPGVLGSPTLLRLIEGLKHDADTFVESILPRVIQATLNTRELIHASQEATERFLEEERSRLTGSLQSIETEMSHHPTITMQDWVDNGLGPSLVSFVTHDSEYERLVRDRDFVQDRITALPRQLSRISDLLNRVEVSVC